MKLKLLLVLFLLAAAAACTPARTAPPDRTVTPAQVTLPSQTSLPTYTSAPTPTLPYTLIPAGLMMVARQIKSGPDLDPLRFETMQGETFTHLNTAKGEFFPNHWSDDYMSLTVTSDQGIFTAQQTYSVDGKNDRVTVTKNGTEIYKVDTGRNSTAIGLKSLWVVDGHWVLEIGKTIKIDPFTIEGQIIEDGVLLNEKYGYEAAFGFQTIHGKPFYFFKREGKIDASYDGQEIALGYDEIPHYGCCSSAELNPDQRPDMVAFFGIMGKTWYFVQIGTPDVFGMV